MNIKVVLLLVVTVNLAMLVSQQVSGINGPGYWQWSWRHIDGWRLFPLTLLGLAPFLAGQILHHRKLISTPVALVLVMCSMLALELGCIAAQSTPLSLERVTGIVQSPAATSYFTDASSIAKEYPSGYKSLRSWLAAYPEHLHERHLHAMNKPPGLLMYYISFIRVFGSDDLAAFAGGLTIGVLATLSIPATYVWLREVCENPDAAFHGASYLALCPALVLFFPEFDQVYPVLTCLLLTAWARAIKRDAWFYSVAFGGLLACILFCTYNLLVLGVFVVGHGLIETARLSRPRTSFIKHSCIAIGCLLLIYVGLWLLLAYDPIETFLTAVENQQRFYATTRRAAATFTSGFDLLDFALGSAWLSVLLTAFFLARSPSLRAHPLVYLVLLQLVVVAVLGILPGETARVWAFMLPLLMIPIGLELSEWGFWPRALAFGCVWLLLSLICQNMTFIIP